MLAATRKTRCRVSCLTGCWLVGLRTREAVVFDTRARRATSERMGTSLLADVILVAMRLMVGIPLTPVQHHASLRKSISFSRKEELLEGQPSLKIGVFLPSYLLDPGD